MKRLVQTGCITLLALSALAGVANAGDAAAGIPCGPPNAVAPAAVAESSKSIEVCFVLDTTGSMGGLIDGAKKKIWTIANSIVAADPKAKVKFALVPYRDRGDQYITRVFDLTDDLDAVFANLQSFTADGGGDGPESVNQAIDDATNKVSWSADEKAVKFLFLVGDAPPHMDYSDDVKYPKSCEVAVKKGIMINTVQCGTQSDTKDVWQEIARRGEGSYVALEQSGGMVVIDTPMDKEIAELSKEIGALAVPYGSEKQQLAVASKNIVAAAAPAAVTAERASYNAKQNRAIQGAGDLITDVREKQIDLKKVADDELPENMRKMSPYERADYLKKQGEERDKLNAKVAELSKQREAYIAEQNKKLAGGKGDAFDAKVGEIVQAELAKKK